MDCSYKLKAIIGVLERNLQNIFLRILSYFIRVLPESSPFCYRLHFKWDSIIFLCVSYISKSNLSLDYFWLSKSWLWVHSGWVQLWNCYRKSCCQKVVGIINFFIFKKPDHSFLAAIALCQVRLGNTNF